MSFGIGVDTLDVQGAAVPKPSTLLLLGSDLAVLGIGVTTKRLRWK